MIDIIKDCTCQKEIPVKITLVDDVDHVGDRGPQVQKRCRSGQVGSERSIVGQQVREEALRAARGLVPARSGRGRRWL